MKSPLLKHLFCNKILVFIAGILLMSATQAQDSQDTVNAIYNGDFLFGAQGWSKLGSSHSTTTFNIETHSIVHTMQNKLVVRCPDLNRVNVYSAYKLNVNEGQVYNFTVNASGTGDFAIGAFCYDDKKHIGSPTSGIFSLTDEVATYKYSAKFPKGTKTIRAMIVFYGNNGKKQLDAKVVEFNMQIPSKDFEKVCKYWPKQAKSKAFMNYKGFSAKELEEIKAVANVNTVVPPYKGIEKSGNDAFKLTTSKVCFDKKVFPASIKILDKEVLNKPIYLEASVNGKSSILSSTENAKQKSSELQVESKQPLSSGNLKIDASSTLTYDGMLIVDLEINPERMTSVEDLSLVIPMNNDVAKYIQYSRSLSTDKWIFGYGPIPAPGQKITTKAAVGVIKNRNDWNPPVPGKSGEIWSYKQGQLPTFWIGDEKRGLGYVNEHKDQNDYIGSEKSFIISRDKNTLEIKVKLINKPVKLDKLRKLSFALQIMPPKTVDSNWTSQRYNHVWNCIGARLEYAPNSPNNKLIHNVANMKSQPSDTKLFSYANVYEMLRDKNLIYNRMGYNSEGFKDISFTWWNDWSAGCSSPIVKDPKQFKEIIQVTKKLKNLGLPYFAATHISSADKNGMYYALRTGEWAVKPVVPSPAYIIKACPNSNFSEYIAWGIGKMIDEYDIEGVYFDNCYPLPCSNKLHGCGYINDKGERKQTIPYLGMRRLFMLIRNEFAKRGKKPFIMIHSGFFPGIVSFIDSQLAGEGTYGSDHTEMFTPGEMRARWIGNNQFGTIQVYLPQFGYGLGKKKVDFIHEQKVGTPRLLAMTLQHGTHIYKHYCDIATMVKVWQVMDELGEKGVKFIPYWEMPDINSRLNSEGIYVSVYHNGIKSVLAISNLSGQDKDVEIPVDKLKKYVKSLSHAADKMSQKDVQLTGQSLKLNVPNKNFRLITLD